MQYENYQSGWVNIAVWNLQHFLNLVFRDEISVSHLWILLHSFKGEVAMVKYSRVCPEIELMVIFKRTIRVYRMKALSWHFINCLSFWYRTQLTSVGRWNTSVYNSVLYNSTVYSSFLSQDFNSFERCCIMRFENRNPLHNTDRASTGKNLFFYTSTLVCSDVVTEMGLRIICIGLPISTLLKHLSFFFFA